jgi:hypothetical protein
MWVVVSCNISAPGVGQLLLYHFHPDPSLSTGGIRPAIILHLTRHSSSALTTYIHPLHSTDIHSMYIFTTHIHSPYTPFTFVLYIHHSHSSSRLINHIIALYSLPALILSIRHPYTFIFTIKAQCTFTTHPHSPPTLILHLHHPHSSSIFTTHTHPPSSPPTLILHLHHPHSSLMFATVTAGAGPGR